MRSDNIEIRSSSPPSLPSESNDQEPKTPRAIITITPPTVTTAIMGACFIAIIVLAILSPGPIAYSFLVAWFLFMLKRSKGGQ